VVKNRFPYISVTDEASDWNLACSWCLPRPIIKSHYKKQEAPLTLWGQRSRCRNIKGESQIYGSFPNPKPRPLFLWVWFSWWALANLSCMPNLKLLAVAVAQILKGTPKFWGAPLSQGYAHFFLLVLFYDGPWQTQAVFFMVGLCFCVFATSLWRPHDPPFIRLDKVPACDGRTDGRNCCRYYITLHCKQCGCAVNTVLSSQQQWQLLFSTIIHTINGDCKR